MAASAVPLATVCIPVHNCERYIGVAIESVLSQTFTDFELVVIDNCSTDGTLDVIRRYSDPKIRVIENETNIGAESNWNKALSLARGKYFKLLCADDYLYPDCLETQAGVLEAPDSEGIKLVSCSRDIVDQHGNRIMTKSTPGRKGRVTGADIIKRSIRFGTNIIGEPSCALLRSEVLPVVGLFDGSISYVIDLDFWCRTLLLGDIYIIGEPLCTFRVSGGSWSVELGRSQAQAFRDFTARLRKSGKYGLTPLDCFLGNTMARVNSVLRRLVYRKALSAGNA